MKAKENKVKYKEKAEKAISLNQQFRLGGARYVAFIIVDLLCLIGASILTTKIYLVNQGKDFLEHVLILIGAVFIDVFVTLVFNTLNRVLRRSVIREVVECLKHVLLCFVSLSFCLFMTKRGALYSRVVVFLTYAFDFLFILVLRSLLKLIINKIGKRNKTISSLVLTTDAFVAEAVESLRNKNIVVKDIYLLKNKGLKEIQGVPVVSDVDEAASAICWERIDKVYIYGLDDQAVPDEFIDLCHEMDIEVELIDFRYRVIDIKTIKAPEAGYGSLAFLEGKRDIPFPIRRVYWITETEANLHRGFHAHKLNCQLLFCPHGSIDIILDDGSKKDMVNLDDPSKGLILMPGLWREMIWRESGSILCVLASEYYDPDEYIRDYGDFINHIRVNTETY